MDVELPLEAESDALGVILEARAFGHGGYGGGHGGGAPLPPQRAYRVVAQ